MYSELGQKVKSLRKRRVLKQDDLAKVLFESEKLTNTQKEDLFTSIMKIYLDSKDSN